MLIRALWKLLTSGNLDSSYVHEFVHLNVRLIIIQIINAFFRKWILFLKSLQSWLPECSKNTYHQVLERVSQIVWILNKIALELIPKRTKEEPSLRQKPFSITCWNTNTTFSVCCPSAIPFDEQIMDRLRAYCSGVVSMHLMVRTFLKWVQRTRNMELRAWTL